MDMDAQRTQQLQDIVKLSREMLDQAQAGAWECVAALELRRREQVMACFSHPGAAHRTGEETAAIKTILRLNQEVTALSQSHRDTLGAEIQTQKKGVAAHTAYANCGP